MIIKAITTFDMSDEAIENNHRHYSGKGYSYWWGNDEVAYGNSYDEIRNNLLAWLQDKGFTVETE
jgi:hypothetical protein